MFKCSLGVPKALGWIFELGEQLDVLAPGQSSNDPLDDCRIGPSLSKGAHIQQIGPREAMHAGKLRAQAYSQAADDLGPPPIPLLPVKDLPPNTPVEAHELGVD